MKIIISPAKNMSSENDFILPSSQPVYMDKAVKLADYLKSLELGALKELLSCSDSIAELNFNRYKNMNLKENQTAALLAYDGIQYKYMAPQVFTKDYFSYVSDNLLILSGLYGILKPFDGIVPYRLEMQTKLKTDFCNNLYDYWGNKIYCEAVKNDRLIINLASEEYAKAVRKYVAPNVKFIDFTFGQIVEGKVKEKGVYVKMARGEMVRFMAENNITDTEGLKEFNRLGYKYSKEKSTENNFVFIN